MSTDTIEKGARSARLARVRQLLHQCELKTFTELWRRARKLAHDHNERAPRDVEAENYLRLSQWSDDQFRKCLADGHVLYGLCVQVFCEVFTDSIPTAQSRADRLIELERQVWGEGIGDPDDAPRARASVAVPSDEDPWAQYDSYLSTLIDATAPGAAIPLRRLYVSLRATYADTFERSPHLLSFLSKRKRSDTNKRSHFARVIDNLELAIDKWLQSDIERYDAVRLIRGGPGSGKSTFAKVLAARFTNPDSFNAKELHRVGRLILVPLQNVVGDVSDVQTVLHQYLMRYGLQPDALPLTDFTPKRRLLLVFDGLDEISKPGATAIEISRTFVSNLQRWLASINSAEVTVAAIVIGRDAVIQRAEQALTLAPHQTLQLVSYILADEELIGERDLLWRDQRHEWWMLWASAVDLSEKELPAILNSPEFRELSSEPLLLYIIALTRTYEVDPKEPINRLVVYEMIMHRIVSNWHNRAGRESVHFQPDSALLRLLEIIAVAAWADGGRTTSGERILEYCSDDQELHHEFRAILAEKDLAQAILAFYMRLGDPSEDIGIEFSHKSFCDFLVARHLERGALKHLCNQDSSDVSAVRAWCAVFRGGQLSEEIARFLEQAVSRWPGPQKTRTVQSCLRCLANLTAHDRPPDKVGLSDAIDCLVVILATLGPVASPKFVIDWQRPNQAAQLLGILSDPGEHSLWYWRKEFTSLVPESSRPSWSRLRAIDFSGQVFANKRLVGLNLASCCFDDCDLRRVDFTDCVLSGASFARANLQGTTWNGSNIANACFDAALVQAADFSLANGITRGQFANAIADADTKLQG